MKGYSSSQKLGNSRPDHGTLQPIGASQFAQDVKAHIGYQIIGADAAEAGTTRQVITATAHAAVVGDIISWTSGTNDTLETHVIDTDTNEITLGEQLPVAPSGGDTFNILRTKAVRVDASGDFNLSLSGGAPEPGLAYADSAVHNYSGTNVTTGAWVEVIASTAAQFERLLLDDTSGEIMEIGIGGGGSETRIAVVPRGGIEYPLQLQIPAASRLSVRAVSSTASTGELVLQGLG